MPKTLIDISGMATIADVLPEFELHLKAAGRSPKTSQSYLEAARQFAHFLTATGHSGELRRIRGADVDAFTVHLRELGRSSATVRNRYASLQAFMKWALAAGELAKDPMAGTAKPHLDVVPVDFPSEAEIKALLRVCEGPERDFTDWRDSALLRLFFDTGCRLSEIVGLKLHGKDDERDPGAGFLDLENNRVLVFGKGSKLRLVAFGTATRKALRQYLAAREKHPHELADSDWLWLGGKGRPLTSSGAYQVFERRSRQAGTRALHPHMLRHARAHDAMSHGMSDGDVLTMFGWSSRQMLQRYGSAMAEERSLESARRIGLPGDRL